MAVAYPPVMHRENTNVDQYPDHANVMAVIATYNEKYGPMPWSVLIDVLASLPSINSTLVLRQAGRRVEEALVDITSDLRALGFLELTADGTVSTSQGHEYIREWNGKFTARQKQARKDLARLRFTEFAAQ